MADDLKIKIELEGKDAKKALKALQGQAGQTKKSFLGLGSATQKLAAGFAAFFAIGKLAGLMKSAINESSNLTEVLGKQSVVFRGLEKDVKGFTDILTTQFGLSRVETAEFLSTIQDTLVPLGIMRKKASDLSNEVVKLAVDLGSFNNLPTEEVILAIQSALVGNVETVRKFGVSINQAVIEQKALSLGLIKTKGDLDAQSKAMAVLKLIQEGTADAQGDFIRTQESFANQTKILSSRWSDFLATLGSFVTNSEVVLAGLDAISDGLGFLADKLGLSQLGMTQLEIAEAKLLEIEKDLSSEIDKTTEAVKTSTEQTKLNKGEVEDLFGVVGEAIKKEKEFSGSLLDSAEKQKIQSDLAEQQADNFKALSEELLTVKSSTTEATNASNLQRQSMLGQRQGLVELIADLKKAAEEQKKKDDAQAIADERKKEADKLAAETAKGADKLAKAFITLREKQAEEAAKLREDIAKEELGRLASEEAAADKLFQLQVDAGEISLQEQRRILEAKLQQEKDFNELQQDFFGSVSSENLLRERELSDKLVAVKKQEADQKQSLQEQATLGIIGSIKSLTAVNKNASKENFAIFKAASLAEAIVAGSLAVQKALSTLPPPFNFIAAGITGAATAVNIASIAGQSPPSFQTEEGQFRQVPGPRNVATPALVHGGEVIGRGGGGGGPSIVIMGDFLDTEETGIKLSNLIFNTNKNTGIPSQAVLR